MAYQYCCPRQATCRLGHESLPSLQEGLGRYDELGESLMGDWVGLDKRGKDLGVLPEVGEEGIATPPPHDLHGLDRHA